MGKGRSFELQLYNNISENTDDMVDQSVADYSGVASASYCDLKMIFPRGEGMVGAFVEAKKRKGKGGNRVIVMAGSSGDESGLEELERLIDGTPDWGTAWLAIKFTNRELIVLDAYDFHHILVTNREKYETSAGPPWFDARLTGSDSISMRKPTLDDWTSSASSQDDWKVLCEEVGVPSEHVLDLSMVEA